MWYLTYTIFAFSIRRAKKRSFIETNKKITIFHSNVYAELLHDVPLDGLFGYDGCLKILVFALHSTGRYVVEHVLTKHIGVDASYTWRLVHRIWIVFLSSHVYPQRFSWQTFFMKTETRAQHWFYLFSKFNVIYPLWIWGGYKVTSTCICVLSVFPILQWVPYIHIRLNMSMYSLVTYWARVS
jgi:hypothetical protein